jgi:hypothetical protein
LARSEGQGRHGTTSQQRSSTLFDGGKTSSFFFPPPRKKTSLVLIFSVKLGNHQFLMAINALDAILSIHLLPLAKI